MKKLKQLIIIPLTLMTLSTPMMAFANHTTTIKVQKTNYTPAKYEPNKGTYLGAYVLQDEHINKDMTKFNNMMEKKHASYFKYVGYGKPFPTEWVEECKAVGAIPHIAFEPNNGLDKVIDDEYLRKFAKDANASGVPIFLRYASEMNGTWTQYSGKSKLYKEKWKLVHKVMKEEAPNVIMTWTVFTFPEHTIQEFYPGDEYVDWVGVNIYNVRYHNDKISARADHEDPLRLLDYVYNTYSHKKPIQISEYGVTNYTTTDNKHYDDFAVNKINRIYGNLQERYPRVKSIFYFDVNNLVNAPEGRNINNYAITEKTKITNAYKSQISSKHYLSIVTKESKPTSETFTYTHYNFKHNNNTYVDYRFFRDYLDLKVTSNNGSRIILSDGKQSHTFPTVTRNITKGFYDSKEKVQGLPLREVSNKFGYKLNFDTNKNIIDVIK